MACGLSGFAPSAALVAFVKSFDFEGGDFCLAAGVRDGFAAGCAFDAGLRAGVAAGRFAGGRLAAPGDVFLAGVFAAGRLFAADLALPPAGDLRVGFACFLTMIILVRYGAARQGIRAHGPFRVQRRAVRLRMGAARKTSNYNPLP